MVIDAPVGHVATKDVPKLVLISASYMRVRSLVLEFDAIELGASYDALLLIDRWGWRASFVIVGTVRLAAAFSAHPWVARVERDYRDQPLVFLKDRPEPLTVSRTFAHLFKTM